MTVTTYVAPPVELEEPGDRDVLVTLRIPLRAMGGQPVTSDDVLSTVAALELRGYATNLARAQAKQALYVTEVEVREEVPADDAA